MGEGRGGVEKRECEERKKEWRKIKRKGEKNMKRGGIKVTVRGLGGKERMRGKGKRGDKSNKNTGEGRRKEGLAYSCG